ncbi:MAG: MIP family channel protein [Leptospiraceae bacterium]|nr:MIP family channel protein [Leptospiraceae bacterium]
MTKKEFLGEFFGSFLLLIFGLGVNTSVTLFKLGDFPMITWGWGLGVFFGILVSARTSGAHLNSAVTITLAWKRGFPKAKVPYYILAQMLGTFFAAIIIYFNYHDAILNWETVNKVVRGTEASLPVAGIFATYPPNFISNTNAFFDQILGTLVLVIIVLAVTDPRNQIMKGELNPFFVGIGVVVIGMTLGGNAGYAINPARDFGPRLATYFLGWGNLVFQAHSNYFWIPIVAPILGGIIGVYVYDFFLGNFLDSE